MAISFYKSVASTLSNISRMNPLISIQLLAPFLALTSNISKTQILYAGLPLTFQRTNEKSCNLQLGSNSPTKP